MRQLAKTQPDLLFKSYCCPRLDEQSHNLGMSGFNLAFKFNYRSLNLWQSQAVGKLDAEGGQNLIWCQLHRQHAVSF